MWYHHPPQCFCHVCKRPKCQHSDLHSSPLWKQKKGFTEQNLQNTADPSKPPFFNIPSQLLASSCELTPARKALWAVDFFLNRHKNLPYWSFHHHRYRIICRVLASTKVKFNKGSVGKKWQVRNSNKFVSFFLSCLLFYMVVIESLKSRFHMAAKPIRRSIPHLILIQVWNCPPNGISELCHMHLPTKREHNLEPYTRTNIRECPGKENNTYFSFFGNAIVSVSLTLGKG